MRGRILVLLIFVSIVFFSGIVVVNSAYPVTDDLIAYHKFEESLVDEEGGSDFEVNEVMFGGTLVYTNLGVNNLGAVAALDDNNVVIAKDTTGLFPSGDWEITFTFQLDSIPLDNATILMLGENPIGLEPIYLSVELRNGDGSLNSYLYNPADMLEDNILLQAGTVEADTLYLYRLKFDGDTETASVYLNDMSNPVDEDTLAGDTDFSGAEILAFIVGNEAVGGGGSPFGAHGTFGNFAIYGANQSNAYFEAVYNDGDIQELNYVVDLSGSGTEEDPYEIGNCLDLLSMPDEEAYYELLNDIDCSDAGEISPLLNDGTFSGDFDGNDFEISGLDIVDDDSVTGLFASLDGATIYALDIVGAVTGAGNETGSLAGRATNGTYIANVSSSMTVHGDQNYVGGLIGSTEEVEGVGVTLVGSTFVGTVYAGVDDEEGVQGVGGLVGSSTNLTVESSSSTGIIVLDGNAVDDVGGTVGYCEGCDFTDMDSGGSIIITDSSSATDIGGILGSMTDTSLVNSVGEADIFIGSDLNPVFDVNGVGGVVGTVSSTSTFESITSDQTIEIYVNDGSYSQYIGGIAGFYCIDGEVVDIVNCNTEITEVTSSSNITIVGGETSQVAGLFGVLLGSPLTTALYNGVIDVEAVSAQFVSGVAAYGIDISLDDVIVDADINVDVTNEEGGYLGGVGGVVGYAEVSVDPIVVTDISSSGTINIGQVLQNDIVEFIGGLVGSISGSADLDRVYSTMGINVDGSDYVQSVGGLIGYHDVDSSSATLDIAYYYGDIYIPEGSNSQFTGGLYGYLALSPGGTYIASDAFTGGEINSPGTEVGGLFGYVEGDSDFTVSNMYSGVTIDAFQVGGLFGGIEATDPEGISVTDMFVVGSLQGPGYVVVAYTAEPEYFNGIYYDANIIGSPPCLENDATEFCIGVNGGGGYFKGNSVNEPMASWTFDENYWSTLDGQYPHLSLLENPLPSPPNEPEDFTIVDYEVGDYIAEAQPTFTFTLTDDDEGELVSFVIQVASDEDFEGPQVSYRSAYGPQGEFEFTVGQASGDGEYLGDVGEEGQELEDGVYYLRIGVLDEEENWSDIFLPIDGAPAFIVDTMAPVLTEVTPIDAEIDVDTAAYGFAIVEENDYEYSLESCSEGGYEADISDVEGVGTVSFVLLEAGSTYECDLIATDLAGNESNVLTVGPFTVSDILEDELVRPRRSYSGVGSYVVSKTDMTYEKEVQRVMDQQIVTENPTKGTNKCEALVMIARAFAWDVDLSVVDTYSDTPAWCKPYAAFATARGIVAGRSEGVLGVDNDVTRYEVAVMLDRELEIQEYPFAGNVSFSFSDAIVQWASGSVNRLAKEGIMKGFEDGTFGGELGILKQDLGVVLLRIKDKL